MRILALASLYPPHVGGAPALIERLVEHLDGCDHEIDLITFGSNDQSDDLHARQIAYDSGKNYTIHRVPISRMDARAILSMFRRVLVLTAKARLRRQPHDVVFCGVAYPCAPMAQVVRFLHRAPYVVYAHGEDVSVVDGGSSRMSRFKAWLLRRSLAKADTVFANSRATRAKLEMVGHPAHATEILPPSIDPARFLVADEGKVEAVRNRLGLQGKRVLLTVARLSSPRKGHDIVVKALPGLLPDHPTLHYLVVGAGDQSALRGLADECGVAAHLTIIDSIDDEELPLLMHLAEVYVMPSRWDPAVQEGEGFGIVYLEAAVAGKPSVAGSTGGAVDAVVHGVTGLTVQPDSVDDVRSAVKTLLDDPDLASALGAAGRRRAVDEYSNSHILPQLEVAVLRAAKTRESARKRQ
jgi:phosphatidylinositol alpha-1,6-mannosyltransferase